MADERRSDDAVETSEEKPATFSGESRGSSANTATGFGRGGDVIVQDDIVYGRPASGRDRAEGDRAPDQPAHEAEPPARALEDDEAPDR